MPFPTSVPWRRAQQRLWRSKIPGATGSPAMTSGAADPSSLVVRRPNQLAPGIPTPPSIPDPESGIDGSFRESLTSPSRTYLSPVDVGQHWSNRNPAYARRLRFANPGQHSHVGALVSAAGKCQPIPAHSPAGLSELSLFGTFPLNVVPDETVRVPVVHDSIAPPSVSAVSFSKMDFPVMLTDPV
jgi:hypothetical protein